MPRPDTGKTPEHVKRSNAARTSAIKRLIDLYPQEWERLYSEEAVKRGITPRNANVEQKIANLEAKLEDLKRKAAS